MKAEIGKKVIYLGIIGTIINIERSNNPSRPYHNKIIVDFGGQLIKEFPGGRGLIEYKEPKKEPKKSNLLELDCEQIGDKVKIVAIRNGMAFEDIREKYGSKVLEIYRKSQVSMCVYADQISMYSGETNTVNVKINESMSAVVHESLMIAMKEAGSNLVKAIKQAKQVKKFTITI